MQSTLRRIVCYAMLAGLATFASSSSLQAALSVTQTNNATTLLNNLLGSTTGLANISATLSGDAAASGTFTGGSFGINSGVVLSTGRVTQIPGVNTQDGSSNNLNDLSTDFGAVGVGGDSVTLTITFDALANAGQLYFHYVFASEEFKEYVNSAFNDAFTLKLNGTNLAKLTTTQDVTINNLGAGPGSVDYINNPSASPVTDFKFDGFSIVELFQANLTPNSINNVLEIKISDVGDGLWDSGVFLQGGSIGTVVPSSQVPEPASLIVWTALALISGCVAYRRTKIAA